MDGEFTPKTPRIDVSATDHDIFEYVNGRLAYHLLEDDHEALKAYTRSVDELVAMAIIRVIDIQSLQLRPDWWETLYLSQDYYVGVSPNHLSDVL